MTTEDTSSGTSATLTPGQPATGKPAPVGATPQPAALSLEEAMKRIAELEHSHGNASEEVERHRKKLTAYEKKEAEDLAKQKAAEEAQLSELERVKKQHSESEQLIQRYKQELVTSKVTLAAHAKGIIDPELAAMAIQNSLEYGEDGMPTNVDKALETLLKNKPYLAPKTAEPTTQAQQAQQTAQPGKPTPPTIPAMSPGRSSIQAPGSNPPGKIQRLSGYKWSE